MNSDVTKQFAVNWNNHMNHVKKAFDTLLNNSELTDVILYAEGRKVGAHKMLLSACSSYFRSLFREFPQDRPIIVLKGVSYPVLTDILKFIYNGEVSVDSDVFDSFLQTAEFLQISGLTDGSKKKVQNGNIDAAKENSKTNEGEPEHTTEGKTSKKGKRSNLETEQSAPSKRLKDENEFTAIKCEPGVLTAIFPEELSDTLQEGSQFSPELILQTAESNDYSVEDSSMKIEDVISCETSQDQFYDETTPSSSVRAPRYNFPENRLKCPICDKEFSHPYSLHHHKPVHLGGSTLAVSSVLYDCEICGKSYKLKDSLSKHLSVHAGYTTCVICSKVLSRKTHLDRHMMQTHGVLNIGGGKSTVTTTAATKPS